MVYRVYVEKKPELANEARALAGDIRDFLGVRSLRALRLLNRYDAEGLSQELFDACIGQVFSEPQLDVTYDHCPAGDTVFAVEYLPGQFDQRADSAAQCIQLISQGERPLVRTAKVYILEGELTPDEIAAVKKYVINPVEAREASLDRLETLRAQYDIPESVRKLEGFISLDRAGLAAFLEEYALAMDLDDVAFCQEYFRGEKRDPTITEIRILDTYWSDHCRHTTFLTTIDSVAFADPLAKNAWQDYLATRRELGRTKPINLMDIGTIGAKYLKSKGLLDKLDESEEINACTVKIEIEHDGEKEPWLLLFKNETHNHPTEIEPFGGAATCIGGAIRDPLSGRSYVYGAMRVTGAADPLRPVEETMQGKLPQRKLVTTAAAGYSSYGNQIGLATGQVDEMYHDGYAAKRLEIGAVIGAAPAGNVRRERPVPGDVVILLGGRTGRDGCGGATGSSKSHTLSSLETCGAEVQKGNAPEERKLQRLFRTPEACRLIKRCNDFGAGGVSVAIGELADGLLIDLDAVPKKYDGLDGTELAISESQERMAVVVAPEDAPRFLELAAGENLEATPVARVTEEKRMVMRWKGRTVCDISREFLNSNGAEKHISIEAPRGKMARKAVPASFGAGMRALVGDLNVCSKRGLSERFDSTIGAGSVLMPFGGRRQLTPAQVMVNKISVQHGDTDDVSLMAWGANPYVLEESPLHGAYLSVAESVAKLVATGASLEDSYLTFQEYFPKPMKEPRRWGQPLLALLGALRAQKELGIAAIGGKDSMSGTFEKLDVPPTLVSFAVTADKLGHIVSNDFKRAGARVCLLRPIYGPDGLPDADSLKALFAHVTGLLREGKAVSAWTPGFGGAAEAVFKMAIGNGFGFCFADGLTLETLFGYCYGSFVLEMAEHAADEGVFLGTVTEERAFAFGSDIVSMDQLEAIYEGKLESVYPCNIDAPKEAVPTFTYTAGERVAPAIRTAKPRVLIPVFPGTNCEYDSAKAVEAAGLEADVFVIRNLTAADVSRSVEQFAAHMADSQVVFIPGGFSGGDEPDGSAKFIISLFRAAAVREQVGALLDRRGGLMLGICNGFQALIKLGLLPYGSITEADPNAPTLTFNTIGRHQSRLVRTRIASNKSPWLANTLPGEIYTVPVSHGEGRFYTDMTTVEALAANGQIATQYVDESGMPTMDIRCNVNGSIAAVEGITSPDGRVLGKMGHSERIGAGLYKNVEGRYNMMLFQSALEFFR